MNESSGLAVIERNTMNIEYNYMFLIHVIVYKACLQFNLLFGVWFSFVVRMSDTVSCGSGDCDCDCFGNSDGCCDDVGGGREDSGAYGATSNGEAIADFIETAIDVGMDAYEPVPTNTSRKKPQDADADTYQCIICSMIFLSVLSIIGKLLYLSVVDFEKDNRHFDQFSVMYFPGFLVFVSKQH